MYNEFVMSDEELQDEDRVEFGLGYGFASCSKINYKQPVNIFNNCNRFFIVYIVPFILKIICTSKNNFLLCVQSVKPNITYGKIFTKILYMHYKINPPTFISFKKQTTLLGESEYNEA